MTEGQRFWASTPFLGSFADEYNRGGSSELSARVWAVNAARASKRFHARGRDHSGEVLLSSGKTVAVEMRTIAASRSAGFLSAIQEVRASLSRGRGNLRGAFDNHVSNMLGAVS